MYDDEDLLQLILQIRVANAHSLKRSPHEITVLAEHILDAPRARRRSSVGRCERDGHGGL
jgi:hypothetical protein